MPPPLAEVLPLTSLLMTLRVPERFRIPLLHRWGRVVVHLAVVFNRGRTGSTNGDRAGISLAIPPPPMAAVLPFTTES